MSSLPDYVTDMNAVLRDNAKWLNGRAPDYSLVNKLYFNSKKNNHKIGSLEDIVNNLVKNWEKEASHKTEAKDWRTIEKESYKFSTNGGNWLTAEDMVKIGTYKAVIGDCEYFMSSCLDLEQSKHIFHECFSEGFAWECIQVYSPPPTLAFKWRHWGKMTGPIRCPMKNGRQLVAEASHEVIEIFGVTVAEVNDKLQIKKLETFFNPNELIEKLAKNKV
jgi:hypothetical protein